ncbi:MAG TPA: hypothetical protein VLA00_02725 [Xanthobacteraceae bacterium]|nr:hypothetical protein [Xanthobacteraceae bacterium]
MTRRSPLPLLALAAVVLSLGAGLAPSVRAEPLAGYDRITVTAAHRPTPVAGSIWYPAGTQTYRAPIGDGPLFVSTYALVGAGMAPGSHPLVLLSHGSGGNMDGLGWLSSRLALRGAIVLAVNHPGSYSGDSSPRRTLRLDERAADLTAALDQLLADPDFAPFIDRDRISVLGFSLGGSTALNLAGVRFDRSRYRDYCARFPTQGDCTFFAKGGVDFAKLPPGFEAETRDARIGAAVAIDPGLTDAATPESLATVSIPVLLINLGGAERWRGIDLSAAGSDLVERLPAALYRVAAPANHFTMLGLCKPGGAERLAEEGDDPICNDPPGTDRAHIHEEIAATVATFLKLDTPAP